MPRLSLAATDAQNGLREACVRLLRGLLDSGGAGVGSGEDRRLAAARALSQYGAQCNALHLTKSDVRFNTVAMTRNSGSSAELDILTSEATMRTTLVVLFLALTVNLNVVSGQSIDEAANNGHPDHVWTCPGFVDGYGLGFQALCGSCLLS